MSATARAEARRKAILSRGTDRLAKLTTSARGEDAPAYMKDVGTSTGVNTAARNFLGEDTSDMPTPSLSTRSFDSAPSSSLGTRRNVSGPAESAYTSPASSFASISSTPSTRKSSAPQPSIHDPLEGFAPDPSVWSPDQQQQFMRALMTGTAINARQSEAHAQMHSESHFQTQSLHGGDPTDPPLPPMDNPLAMLFGGGLNGNEAGMGGMPDLSALAALGGGGGFGGLGGAGVEPKPKTPPSAYQKFAPLLHLVLLWSLLSYFVFWFEPKIYAEKILDVFPAFGTWDRWRVLGGAGAGTLPQKMVVQVAPFFWAFMTLEVMLHSIQIFTGSNTPNPPALLALALPHIPPPFPSIIMNSLKYIKMLSFFLDDVAGVVVGLGVVVAFSGL